MNILVIGDSHAGSLKRAYDEICNEMGDVKFHFVAGRGWSLSHLKVKEGVLYSDKSQTVKDIEFTFGSSVLDINKLDPDAILLYGMGFNIPFNFLRSVINERYSSSFVEKCFKQFMFIGRFGYRLAINVASASKADTYIASPFPSSEGLEIQEYSTGAFRMKLEAISFFQERFLNDLNLNYYLQPANTFNPKCKTFTKFTEGSKELGVGDNKDDKLYPSRDYTHMNDEFGELFIRSFTGNLRRN